MKAKILLFILVLTTQFLFSYNLFSNPKETPFPKPVTGMEEYESTGHPEIKINPYYKLRIPPVHTNTATVLFSPMGVNTVYDLQTNGVPQQIWQDPLTPTNVHATMMYSTVPGFATRGSAYFFSNDNGATWTYLGDVPNSGRSGFPAISGYTNGAAIIANHNNTNGTTTRTKLYFDAGPGFGVFSERDPGDSPGGQAIWPRVVGIGNDKMSFVSSINGATLSYTNTYNNGVFSGYVEYPGDQAETYSLAIAPNGKIGHAFIGSDNFEPNDVFYRSSTDNGLTWTAPQKIWDWNVNTDSLGCLRGVSMVFGNNSEPYVAFNISILTETGFFPTLPSSIRVWSPGINGGVAKVIADQSNVPFFGNTGATTDAFLPVCRPAIGRSSTGSGLVVAFLATTGQYGSTDTSAYYAAWATYTGDGGNIWVAPERMTPTTPLRDWRFVSVSPTNSTSSNQCTVQMTCQSDSLPGTHVNGSPLGIGQLVGIRYIFSLNSTPAAPTLITPSNNSTNIPLTPLMDWSNVSNADTYGIQISTNNGFTNNVVDQGNLTNSEYQVAASVLNYNTPYYWRVNGVNINGTGLWSSVFTFTTESLQPAAPVLIAPLNNSVNIPLTPLMDWSNVSNADSYRIQISTNNAFTNNLVDQGNITISEYQVTGSVLMNDSNYYWRVNGTNINGTGDWSAVFSFRTESLFPSAPVLVSPPNNSSGITLTPTLDWNNVTGALSYGLQVSADSGFSSTVIDLSNQNLSQYAVPTSILNGGTKYYWRANAANANGSGAWCGVWNFTTLGIPAIPNLITPVNGATQIILTPSMTWSSVPNAASYRIMIAADSNFTNVIVNTGSISANSYNVPSGFLSTNSGYYWRVNATNVVGTGPWSAVFNFRTISPPEPPILALPVNNATGVILTPLLDWNNVPNAFTYNLQIATDSNFSNIIHDPVNLSSSQYTVPSPYLSYLSKYYWRVRALNGIGTGDWSVTFNFTTINVPPPTAPTLISPSNGSVGISLTPLLDWISVSSASSYGVQISSDVNFNNIVHSQQNISNSEYTVPSFVLSNNTLYFWRVNASNSFGTSGWSSEWVFRTLIIGIENIGTVIPEQYMLHTNYPNPFNPSTKIEFDLPEASDVEITVYDFLGRKIADLVKDQLPAGSYRTEFEAGAYSSGIYFYRIRAGKFVETKRMILVK